MGANIEKIIKVTEEIKSIIIRFCLNNSAAVDLKC